MEVFLNIDAEKDQTGGYLWKNKLFLEGNRSVRSLYSTDDSILIRKMSRR